MSIIEEVEISKLNFLEDNPRKITAPQMKKLCESLKSDTGFLYDRPVLVNRKPDGSLHIYAGNQRVRAAQKLKWKKIPCSISDDLSDNQIKSRIIKDNKTYGTFDFDILANHYELDLLFECGFTAIELEVDPLGAMPEDDLNEDIKPKKCKTCPGCGIEL